VKLRQFILEYICNVSPTPPPNKRMKQGVPPPLLDEVRPIEAELCTPEEARTKFDEFFKHYQKGGGANLRVELVRGLPGIRFTLVGSWDDMS